jgi:hypothetical protein
MKRNDCIVDCIGPDCEGCRDYKTAKSMKPSETKPTKEEILKATVKEKQVALLQRNPYCKLCRNMPKRITKKS